METALDRLQIELEDVGGTSWWASLLTTLGAQWGSAALRFVGAVDGERRYAGSTFSAPRTLGTLPPQEAWAPGMTEAFDELRREVEDDGWVEVGRGAQPWSLRYQRPAGHAHLPTPTSAG